MRAHVLAIALLLLGACDAPAIHGSSADRADGGDELASRGVLGGYEHGRVWGWAQIVGDETPVHVRIDVDGRPVAMLVADQLREDLVELGLHPTGAAGFEAITAELPMDSAVEAFIEETGARLTNSPCAVQGHGPVSSCTEGTTRGWVGGYAEGIVWGWAQIVGYPSPVHIRLEVDGVPLVTALADRPRPDLVERRLHTTGAAGLRVRVGDLPTGAMLAAFVDETNEPLMGSPITVDRGIAAAND